MEQFEKELIDGLSGSDKKKQLSIIAKTVKNKIYSLLPEISKLISLDDLDISNTAKEAAISLSIEYLKSKGPSPIPEVVFTAVNVIRKFTPDYIEETNLKLFKKEPSEVIDAIFFLKSFVNENEAKKILLNCAKNPNHKVRATAVLHMGLIASRKNTSMLSKFLSDMDNRTKANTIEVFEQLGNKNFTPIIMRFKGDSNNRVRANTLKALYNLGKYDIYYDLKEMLLHENYLMRTSAVWVIGEIGLKAKNYLELLKHVVEDQNKLLCDNLLIVLKKVGTIPELEFIRVKMKDQLKEVLKANIIKTTDIKLEKIAKPEYLLIKLIGSVSSTTCLSLRFQLEDILLKHKNLVFDFTEVQFIDSSGIRLLLNTSNLIEKSNGFIFIFNCIYQVKELFQISNLDRKLQIFQTEEEIQDFISI